MKHGRDRKSNLLGRYIVADPKICHGKPTFRGTRIMVWQVLEQMAGGMAWETIIEGWEGKFFGRSPGRGCAPGWSGDWVCRSDVSLREQWSGRMQFTLRGASLASPADENS